MDLRLTKCEVLLEAVSPIAQAEGTDGNHSSHMARKVVQPDGSVVRVPTVTADTMRHKMRAALTYALLDAAGMLQEKGPELTESALRLLFNGGMLTGRGSATAVKLTDFRDLMHKLPSLALFGGCANNHLIAGQLTVQDGQLVCEETWHLLPPWVQQWCNERKRKASSFRAYLDEEMRVRFDPTRQRHTQQLLSGEALDHTNRMLEASEKAHDENNAVAREATKSTMLPRTCEVIAPGSLFYWSVTARTYDALEEDTFKTAIAAFLAQGQVGGKGGTGHGHIRPIEGRLTELARPAATAETLTLDVAGTNVGKIFKAHVTENAAAIRKALSTVDA